MGISQLLSLKQRTVTLIWQEIQCPTEQQSDPDKFSEDLQPINNARAHGFSADSAEDERHNRCVNTHNQEVSQTFLPRATS